MWKDMTRATANQAPSLIRAIEIAIDAHSGQADKTGMPYFEHCKRVAQALSSEEEQIVAYLHDTVEKSANWTLARLQREGFDQQVLEAVEALTKREGETDDEFVSRAVANTLARGVKVADLSDNLAQTRQVGGDTSKYAHGLAIADEITSGRPASEQ